MSNSEIIILFWKGYSENHHSIMEYKIQNVISDPKITFKLYVPYPVICFASFNHNTTKIKQTPYLYSTVSTMKHL